MTSLNIREDIENQDKTFMRPLRGSVKPFKFFSFDIETYGIKNKLLMIGVYGYSQKGTLINEIFYKKEDFIKFLKRQEFTKYGYKMVATNLMFDFFGIFYEKKYHSQYKTIVRGSNLLSAEIFGVKFLDTMNYAFMGVARQGDLLGLPKLSQPKYIEEKRKPEPEELDQISFYCLRDCEITYKFMEFLQQGFNKIGANCKMTIASTAMDLFRRKYLKKSIMQPSPDVIEQMRDAYFGGRTEVFKRGKVKNLYKYDYKSCYPSVMIETYPDPNYLKSYDGCHPGLFKYEGISKVKVTAPYIKIPFLPMRYKRQGSYTEKLLFPYGEWVGWYTHAEIRYASKLGYKFTPSFTFYYTKNCTPFQDYVKTLYSIRQKLRKDNNPLQLTYKLLLNSLYGKFAQRLEYNDMIHRDNFDPDEHKEFTIDLSGADDFVFITKKADKIPSFVNPIWSIYVTAKSRIKLYEDFLKAGLDNVYYCDTDSIFTSVEMETGKELGDLDFEDYIVTGELIKPKMYHFINSEGKEVYKAKGIPKPDAKKWEKLNTYSKIEYESFIKIRKAVRSKVHHKYGKLTPNEIIMMDKTVSLNDDKRGWKSYYDRSKLQESEPLLIHVD